MTSASWGSDAPISMPVSLPDPNGNKVPMYGFCFTPEGLFHDLSEVDLEDFSRPTYAPVHDPQEQVVYGDLHPDG